MRLPLGAKADEEGIRKARQTAYQIQDALLNGSFRWDDWDPQAHRTESLEQILQRFESIFFDDPERLLNPKGALSTESRTVDAGSKKLLGRRQESGQCGTVLKALAYQKRITLPENWDKHSKSYKVTKKRKRTLPTDQQIIEAWGKIPSPEYRWIFRTPLNKTSEG